MASESPGIPSEELGSFDCLIVEEMLRKEYDQLSHLPYTSMDNQLFAKDVITLDEKLQIESKIGTEKMAKLLNIIIASLRLKQTTKYLGFLKAMEESKDITLKQTAKRLAKTLIFQMLQQAKNVGLTINMRHGNILVCGASCSGKTSFSNLLKNKRFEPVYAGDYKPLIKSEKINVQEANWITLDHKLEVQEVTKRLINMQQAGSTSDANISQRDNYAIAGSSITVEEQMITYSPIVKLQDTLPETWDIFTLHTGGNPEFMNINMLPAISTCADITFIVLDISNGKKCLNTLVPQRYDSKDYNYSTHDLKYTNKYMLNYLLSSVKDAAMKKYLHPEIIKVTNDEHPQPVVCIIGTHADVLKYNFGDKYDEELHEINKEVKKLVEPIIKDNVLVIWSTEDSFVIPIDNTISREQVEESFQNQNAINIQRIREKSNRVLRKKAQYKIPISWFILELELRIYNEVCIPLTEVKNICDKIMPSHRKMKIEEIKKVLKFYHLFGMLMYYEVDGMNNFVITSRQWLFMNLNQITMCTFVNHANNLYGAHHIEQMKNGIFHMELFRRLPLYLPGDELESFLNLLKYFKIIAPLMDNSYFMPNVLPLWDERYVFAENEYGKPAAFTVDGQCIVPEVQPLLIEFSFGTIPRGLFGFLIVQLLQDNSDVFELYGKNDHTLRRCSDLLSFFVKPCYYVTICDRISYLELQVRVKGNELSYHYKVQTAVTKALKKICENFNWQFNDCRYGFLCHEHAEDFQSDHLTLLSSNQPIPNEFPKYALCNYQQVTFLTKAQSIWFEDLHEVLRQQDENKRDNENRKVVLNKIFDNLVQKMESNEETEWPPRQLQVDEFNNILMHYRDMTAVEYIARVNCHKEGASAIDKLASAENQKLYPRNIRDIFISTDITKINCIIIEGPPGIGKSTLAKDIEFLWMRKEMLKQYKALFSVLFNKIQRTLSVAELFKNMTSEYLDSEEIDFCNKYFINNIENQLCILIDELDDDSAINPFITKLICGEVLPNALVIVFSQPTCTLKLPLVDRKVKRIEIMGFNKTMQNDFIRKSLGGLHKKKLVKYLKLHRVVNEICYIPFYLSMVVYLFKNSSLPKTITEMCKLLILHTIRRHLKKHDSTFLDMEFNDIQGIPKRQLCAVVENLSRLAFKASKNDKNLFTMDEIINECPSINDVVGAVKGFGLLQAMECYTQQEGTKSIKFGFRHYAMQEYLAAYYVSCHLTPEEQLSEMKATFWKEPFKYNIMWKMFAGMAGITPGTTFEIFLNTSQNKTWSEDLSQLELPEEITENKAKCLYLNQCFDEAGIIKKPSKVLRHYMEYILNQAKQDKVTVHVRHTKVMLCGASGAGKTCLTCLLKHIPIPEQYRSTDLGKSMQIFVVNKKEKMNITWTELDEDKEIDKLTNQLLSYITKKKLAEEDDDLENIFSSSPDNNSQFNQNDEPKSVARVNETSQPAQTDTSKSENKKFEYMDNVDSVEVENKIASELADKSNKSTDSVNSEITEETWDILTLLDTGGQSEFINLLPAISRSTTVSFVVLNMLDGIKERLKDKHSERKKERTLNYTNEHLSQSLLSVIKESSKSKMSYLENYIKSKHDQSSGPGVCFACTHCDEVKDPDQMNSIFKEMCSTVDIILNKVGKLDTFDYDGHVVTKINNKLAGKQEMENSDSIANKLRQFVHKHQNFQPVYCIPITWLILELELRKQTKVCLKFNDVKKISERILRGNELSDDELKIALQFFHDFGVLLYFDELEDFSHYVVKDMNWLFKILTKLACSSETFFEGIVCNSDHRKSFQNGFFKRQLLDDVQLDTGDIDKDLFLKLLEHLKIAASMPDEDNGNDVKYFMPCILKTCPWESHKETEVLDRRFGEQVIYCNEKKKVNSLLIKFASCPIPRGLFCFLVVSLIQLTDSETNCEFKPYCTLRHRNEEGYHHPFANLIVLKVTKKACDGLFSLSLHDRILYLELQIRVKSNKNSLSIHHDIKNIVCGRLCEICKKFGWEYNDLRYGFSCVCDGQPISPTEQPISPTEQHMVVYSDKKVWECEEQSEYHPTIRDLIWFKDMSGDLKSEIDDTATVTVSSRCDSSEALPKNPTDLLSSLMPDSTSTRTVSTPHSTYVSPEKSIAVPMLEYKIFKQHYSSLTKLLYCTDVTLYLIQEGVIVPQDQEEIDAITTSSGKAKKVLLKVSSALEAGLSKSFKKVLQIMKVYGNHDAQHLSTVIKHEITSSQKDEVPLLQSTVGAPFTGANTTSSAPIQQGTNHKVNSSTKDEGLISHDELKSVVDKISIVETNDSTIKNRIQILLVTANETEYGAALTFLDPVEGFTILLKYHHVNSRINKHAVYIFGKFGYFNAAVHLMTQQGPAAAQDVVTVAGDCFGNNLNAIFAVGVACGVEGKSKMLDVLVSKTISSYTAARISNKCDDKSDDEYEIQNRSPINMPVSSFLTTYFDQLPKWPGEKSIAAKLLNKPTQVSGNILSGNYLIDNTKFKQKLLEAFANNAIGIEMEGAGLFQDYPDTRHKIMVIKAVCDFGDGKKDKRYQPTAAMLAVECLKHCIGSSPNLPQNLAESCGNKEATVTTSSRCDSSKPLPKKPKTESHNKDEDDQDYTSPNNERSKDGRNMKVKERSRESRRSRSASKSERNLDSNVSRSREHSRKSRSDSRDKSTKKHKERSNSRRRYIDETTRVKASRPHGRSTEKDIAYRRSRSRERKSRGYYSSHTTDATTSISKSRSPLRKDSSRKHKMQRHRSRSPYKSRHRSKSPSNESRSYKKYRK